ncbi:MAG: chitobiase/beta-hexosaminidase C-terminal domain-containing protein [Syntrophomonas sp.]
MTLIKDIIKIQGGYSAQVKLKEEFEDRGQNIERMSHYKPIQAHRKAFEVIAEGIYKKDSKRCFILSGSYGTGKSHLCLMAANYLENPSDMPEMEQFFINYKEAEEEEATQKAQQLQNIRKTGRYLVCICDYGLETSFETIVLRAIKDALIRENIDIEELDSHYLQALKKLDLWESQHPNFYKEFEGQLENTYSNWTMAKFKKSLNNYSKEAIEIFKELHKKITTADFDYDKDNIVEIIKQMSNSKVIHDRFKGIAILFDEFDNQIKNKRFDVTSFQKFGEMCENSFVSGFITIFIATIHRSFLSYKSVYNDADFQVASDRIKEIPMETQGIEDIISAIVIPQKDSPGWLNDVETNINIFNNLASKCVEQGIFLWLSAPKRRKRIIENIYPMHPMATYSLLKLASDVGSNNRSVFTFFADEKLDAGSYDWFVRNHHIISQNGELQLYTVDLLFDYFGSKITTDNTELRSNVKDMVRDYETSVRELNKHRQGKQDLEIDDEYYDRILRTMIIYNIISVPVNMDNLLFGLNCNNQQEEKQLEYFLKNACKLKIIYLNDTNHCYEFRKSDAQDISGLIREYKQDPENMPVDIMAELKEEIIKHPDVKGIRKFFKNEEYLEPKTYNASFFEDKRLKRYFVTVKEIEADTFFADLDKLVQTSKTDIKKSYEATVIYVICESLDEVRRAITAASKNVYPNLLVGVPSEEIPIFDTVFSLKGCINIKNDDFSPQDQGVLKEYINTYDKRLEDALNKYITSRNLIYYSVNGTEISRNNADNNKAASSILEGLYDKTRNKFKHEDLNVCHEFKGKKNTALKEAVESLLDFSGDFGFRSNLPADRGDKRYIEKALLHQGVITKLNTIGERTLCQFEINPEKYKGILPALSAMIEEIKGAGGEINIISMMDRLMVQYGLGYNAYILFFAVMLRYFKESVHIKPDVNEIGSLKPSSYDDILDLLHERKYMNAVIVYKNISETDQAFVKKIFPIFVDNENLIKDEISISELFDAMKEWYKNIPTVAKVKEIYKDGEMDLFLDIFQKLDITHPVEFVLEELKTIYGYEKDELLTEIKAESITQKLKIDKTRIEAGYDTVEIAIINQVKKIYSITESSYDAILQKLNDWYEKLSDVQKDSGDYYHLHNENSKPLVHFFGKGYSLQDLLMTYIPGEKGYKLATVKDWTTDKTSVYMQKISLGKKHIEENIFLVEAPEFIESGTDTEKVSISTSEYKVYYRKKVKVTINLSPQHDKIYITSNGDDPTKQESQREIKSESYQFTTNDNKKIMFAATDKDGRYSKVVSIILENEEKKYEVTYKKQEISKGSLWENPVIPAREYDEPKIEVTLPKDKESMKKCVLSLFNKSIEKYQVDKAVLRDCLDEIKNEL